MAPDDVMAGASQHWILSQQATVADREERQRSTAVDGTLEVL